MNLKYSKEAQTAHRRKRKVSVLKITESQLQEQLNDLLNAYQIRYIRIPDSIWHWLKRHAPVEVVSMLSRAFGGMPDNVCFVPIDEKYSLALGIELKVKNRKKHGKQKHWQSTVSRTPDENIETVNEYLDTVETIKEVMKRIEEDERNTN